MPNTPYTLFELNEYLRRVIALNMPARIWVKCELAEIKSSRGHYFLGLMEQQDGAIKARAEGVIWQQTYRRLRAKLETTSGNLLRVGLQILAEVQVDFHERYGLKLILHDIDPSYTLGQFELQRQAVIQQLEQEDLLQVNRQIPLPLVLQRIAIISSDQAAGLQDFLAHLAANTLGYKVDYTLFETAMQGTEVAPQLQKSLQTIAKQQGAFDVVVILRGGGARLDLSAFDSLEVGRGIAQFPLAILTGIGHEKDTSVADLVAHTALKTPTAVADFILSTNVRFEQMLVSCAEQIASRSTQQVQGAMLELSKIQGQLALYSNKHLSHETTTLINLEHSLHHQTETLLQESNAILEVLEKTCELLNPARILQRGFTQTYHQGKIVTNPKNLQAGDYIQTQFSDGTLDSQIQ